jgi:translation initiation factor 2B subunit (eIF-2B alpha/beta/delta family)
MADALRKALTGLKALAGDHRSGAAEIADRAVTLLHHYCQQEKEDDPRLPYALGELAETMLTVQPSMAPLLNLANLIQLAAEQEKHSLRSLRASLEKFRKNREQAVKKIAPLGGSRLRRYRTVLTYSYSSTVLAALAAAARTGRSRTGVERVILSESRPLYEGRVLAEGLAAKGVSVTMVIDAALREQVASADAVVVGADTVLERAYVNRLGTRVLQEHARTARKPFFVLADTSKFLPPVLAPFHKIEEKPSQEVWRDPPKGVTILNRYFQLVPFERHVTLLSERGVMPLARLRGYVEHIEVARRWSEYRSGENQ